MNAHLYISVELNGETTLVGQAWFTHRRGETSTVFSYSPTFLAASRLFQIDPQLPLVSGNQYVDSLPGCFADCAPDRWGRLLIERNHRRNASAGERQRDLNEVDFLTGVSDRTRQGALRFSASLEGDYLDIAEAVADISVSADLDLVELYRRAALNVAINNTDDHLRNHGFLANGGGWRLSPVFDINPNPNVNAARVTSIAGCLYRKESAAALSELARTCRLTSEQTAEIDQQVHTATQDWRTHATRNAISAAGQTRFSKVFAR